jgi:hypothetical protein
MARSRSSGSSGGGAGRGKRGSARYRPGSATWRRLRERELADIQRKAEKAAAKAAPGGAKRKRELARARRARADLRSLAKTGMSARQARQKRKEAVPEKLERYAKILQPENREPFLALPIEMQQVYYETALQRRAEWIEAEGPESLGHAFDPFIAYHSAV